MLITVEAVTKDARQYNDQRIWGVKTPDGIWYSLYCDFRPSKGQQFDVAVHEKTVNGKVYRDAKIIGPAPIQQQQRPAQAPAPAQQAKIPWADWAVVIQSAWEAASAAGMPPAEAVAVVNTTLIAFSNGKLETPIEAGPVSDVGNGLAAMDGDDVPW